VTLASLTSSKPQEATQINRLFGLTALSLFLGLKHIADMDGVAERDRTHWDAALASINFAAHALASS
jgi:hypothetical protein